MGASRVHVHRGLLRAAAEKARLWDDGDAGEPLLPDAEPALHRLGMQVRIRTNSLECKFAPNSHEFVDHSELEFATSNSNPP